MIWLLFIISGAFILLIINGMIHQERYVIWKRKQAELVEVKKREMDDRKKVAADRIKDMLRETRRRTTAEIAADDAAATQAATHAAVSTQAAQPSQPASVN